MAAFEEALSEAGLRMTHQRLEIFAELAKAKDHPSAEMVFERVRERMPTVSLDTVYRTLTTFEELGLVLRLQVFADQARFDAVTEPHHHLVCDSCKAIVDFNWSVFEGADLPAQAEEWGSIARKQVVLRGLCRTCLKQRVAEG